MICEKTLTQFDLADWEERQRAIKSLLLPVKTRENPERGSTIKQCARCGTEFKAWNHTTQKYCCFSCYRPELYVDRFWSAVDKNGPIPPHVPHLGNCWTRSGRRVGFGYAGFSIKTMHVAAHRFAWMITNGEIPRGLLVCHHCDNPPCVRPSHLFIGTHQDNSRDCVAKGRLNNGSGRQYPVGEESSRHVMTESKVRFIRDLYWKEAEDYVEIARRFRVSATCIRSIIIGRTWKHIDYLL